MTDCDSGAVFGFILPSSSWTAQFRSAHTAAGNRDILPVQDCTTGTLLECGGSCCQLQAGLLLLRIWWQAVICSITLHDVISYVIASVCRFWASCPFRLRLLYKTSIRHDCREYIYIYTNNKSNNKKNETLCYIIFVKWYYILHGVSSILAVLLLNVHGGTGQTRKAIRQSENNNMMFCPPFFFPKWQATITNIVLQHASLLSLRPYYLGSSPALIISRIRLINIRAKGLVYIELCEILKALNQNSH